MNGQMRNKAGLLSRVSTLAILAAAGSLGATQQAQAACGSTWEVPGDGTIILTNNTCVVVNDNVTGDVENRALIGDPGPGYTPFDVQYDITGKLINNGNIFGGDSALTIENSATIFGGIVNNQVITSAGGNAIQIGTSSGGEGLGVIENGILNTDDISSGGAYGIAALYGSLSGGVTNRLNATISGGQAAIYIADTFGSWQGDIFNQGQISGHNAAIQIGDWGGEGSLTFNGNIVNDFSGTIVSATGPAILITDDLAAFNGNITNWNRIAGGDGAVIIQSGEFNGDFDNNALIIASSGDGVYAQTDWTGNFNNAGNITSGGGTDDFGFQFEGATYVGNFNNSGQIVGGEGGVTFGSDFGPNPDLITGADGNAQLTNTGSITGTKYGFFVHADTVNADFNNTFAGPFAATPSIVSTQSNGAGVVLAADSTWTGDVTNDGYISGALGMVVGAVFSDGFVATGGDFHGNITNTGQILGTYTGLYVTASNYVGNVNNSGNISGGDVGAAFVGASTEFLIFEVNALGTFQGTITNSGSMTGGNTGLYVSFNEFTGNIVNSSTGYIHGNVDGAVISVGTMTGDIINDGVIIGENSDTGLHVIANNMTGDIVNNGLLSAPSNALHVQIGDLDGGVINTGLIEATNTGNSNAVAVRLEVGNGTTFTNTDGGQIFGDVVFGGKAPYTFLAEDGSIDGALRGEGGEGGANDDVITVQNGTHAFYFTGKHNGTASNFSDFNVNDGGFAVMGAMFEGDPNGSGYAFSNVDAVHVNNGGTLYIDKSTTLNVDNTYVQAAGGTLEFYLGAPGGEGFSSLTGTQVAVAGVDYGQIHMTGSATLNGMIAGFLDPAFASANSSLDEVDYNDVLVADGGISGDFTTVALLSDSSLFELNEILDGNTVDLRLTRTSLGDIGDIGGIIVNTGGPFDSNVSDHSNGMGAGCGMAGAGWCLNRFAANEPGATSVMDDSTPGEDPFGWLRTGVRRVGETAAWGRAVGVWGNTDGDLNVAGSDFRVGGAIVGVDHVFTPVLMAGVAAQWTTTSIDFDARPDNADVDSFEAGVYGSYGDTRLYLNANASVIFHNINVHRFSPGGQALGDYDGTTISGYAEAGKIFETEEGFRIQPLIAVSYSHLETDAYSETGTGTLLNVFDSDFDSLKSMLGSRFAYPIRMASGRKLVPEVRIAWTHEFLDDQSSFLATVQGAPPAPPGLIVGEKFSRDTIVLGTGLAAPLSDATSLFLDYDAGLNTDITTHTVSAGFRTRW